MSEIKRTVASLKAKIAINDFLQPILAKLPNGTFQYKGDWNDDKVAEFMTGKLGEPITGNTVKNVRQELYGKLYMRKVDGNPALEKRVSELETLVLNMADELSKVKLAIKFNPKI